MTNRSYRRNGPPLRCAHCLRDETFKNDADKVTATGATQMLTVNGQKKLHSELLCSHGWKWWSRHKDAHTLDRATDYQQQVDAGRIVVE